MDKTNNTSAAPAHILIVGAGLFGLSTALALAKRPLFASSRITVIDRESGVPDSHRATTSSVDTSRLIRSDYADNDYAELAREATKLWPLYNDKGERNISGKQCFFPSGIVLTAGAERHMYVEKSLANCLKHESSSLSAAETSPGAPLERVRKLEDKAMIAAAMRTAPGVAAGTGEVGYYNPAAAWAHAEICMRNLWDQVAQTGRVAFVTGEAARLLEDEATGAIIGAELRSGQKISDADLTIVAAGAWSPALVDLRGRASATAQCLGYVKISEEEGEAMKNIPVHLNLGTGKAIFSVRDGETKMLRHMYGYTNPVEIPAPVGTNRPGPGSDKETSITVSLPVYKDRIPRPDAENFLSFLKETLPHLARENRSEPIGLSCSRLCWYLDTKHADFLACWHPQFQNREPNAGPRKGSLFLATGGSGHAFKFLPVIGEKIVDIIDETDLHQPSDARPGSAGRWTKKWAWPERQQEDEVWCDDGSRSGRIGDKLEDAMLL